MRCPYCHRHAQWVPNEQIYGKRFGKSYMVWWCKPCDAYVGCHGNTRVPLGTMANKELREWRVKAHEAIDPLWKSGKMSRVEVYEFLRQHFGREIHIGEANIKTCQKIIRLAERSA